MTIMTIGIKFAALTALLLILYSDQASAGPAEKESRNDAEEVYLRAESLKSRIDSIGLLDLDSISAAADSKLKSLSAVVESLKFSTFREIIIDEDGTIKIYSDTGLISIIDGDSAAGWPKEWEHATKKGDEGIVSWGKNVVIDEDMQVDSDIQVFSGNVTVKGSVIGDVQVMGGDIYVSSTGHIKGNAMALGGKIKVDEGGKIAGLRIQTKLPFGGLKRKSVQRVTQGILLIIVAFGLLLSTMVVALFPEPVEKVSRSLRKNWLKSFFIGYAGYFAIFVIWILLLVSVIGIPLAILGQPIGLLIIMVLSHAAITLAIGESMIKSPTPLEKYFYGSLPTTIPPILLLLIGYFTDSLPLMVINFVLLGIFIFLFLPFGLGAALLSWMEKKKGTKEQFGSAAGES